MLLASAMGWTDHWNGWVLVLRIRDWDAKFENHKTRVLKHLDFVLVPNKMDGDGYTELVDHPDGAAHFGVWIILLEIASKCSPRGNLARSGGVPHDCASLARVSRLQSAVIAPALRRIIEIGWIVETTPNEISNMALSGADPALSGDDPAQTGRRTEEKRTEENRTEEKKDFPKKSGGAKKKAHLLPHEVIPEEWASYAIEKLGWTRKRADDFFETMQLWAKSKSSTYADWTAAWKGWCRRENEKPIRNSVSAGSLFPAHVPDRIVRRNENDLLINLYEDKNGPT